MPVKRLIYGLLLSLTYMFALPKLGFVAANIPLFGGLMYLYGERRLIWIGLGSIIISVFVFLVFRMIFQIILPGGVLGDISVMVFLVFWKIFQDIRSGGVLGDIF